MKLYIAGPMTGLPEFNYPAFRTAGSLLHEVGHEPLNPVDSEDHNPTPGAPQAWDWYMRRALRMVTEAEGLALLEGWHRSRGARLEVHVATSLDLPCEPLEFWLTRGQGR